ncbi:MAG: hypothetical protein IJT21_07015 [Synergistaceae bacterium]|nr:hypothetical protein [Synergistaceae bacterium]
MRVKNFLCVIILLLLVGISEAAQLPRRISVVIFPAQNSTELEVWESKFYPYDVLRQKMNDYLESMFKRSPLVDVRTLDEAGMNQWLSSSRRGDDMAVQIELFSSTMRERHVLGNYESAKFLIRIRVYDTAQVKELSVRNVKGTDRRFTLDSESDVFFFDATIKGLGRPFRDGLDLFGLTQQPYKGQRMSRPTWQQFNTTPYWAAIRKAIEEAQKQAMTQIRNAIRSNDPSAQLTANDNFSPSYVTAGRILSPTADSKRIRRKYIISLGAFANCSQDGVRVGEILDVVRSDTYVTVSPEEPIAVIPKVIGKVKVIKVYEDNAIVQVIRDNQKEPIQLNDLVIKRTTITGR